MKDDSLSDTQPAKLTYETYQGNPVPVTDKWLIAEIKKRGYKVYPEKRVRIYASQEFVSRREVEMLRSSQGFMDHTEHRLAIGMGTALRQAGALVLSREDRRPGMDYGIEDGTIFRAQVCVVLPNDWDFEGEMWGIPQGHPLR
jgi:hypothetical protein